MDAKFFKDFIDVHYILAGKKDNKSNRYLYTCRYCPDNTGKIEHRDNRLLIHLTKCPATPGDVKARASAKLITKVGADEVFTFPTPQLVETEATGSSEADKEPHLNSRKRLREDTMAETAKLSAYVHYPLTEKETQTADMLFLR